MHPFDDDYLSKMLPGFEKKPRPEPAAPLQKALETSKPAAKALRALEGRMGALRAADRWIMRMENPSDWVSDTNISNNPKDLIRKSENSPISANVY